jgi:hypothetical protein
VAVLFKHFTYANKLKDKHPDGCETVCSEAGCGIDIAGLKNVFQSSLPRYNVRYINFVGGGDSEAFGAMEYLKTYSNVMFSRIPDDGKRPKTQ